MSQSGEAASEMSSTATSGNFVLFLFSLVWGRSEKEGEFAFRELGGPPTDCGFITQCSSWVLDLLIKDIISQKNQPRSQHDWECLINTKEKRYAWAKSLERRPPSLDPYIPQEICFSQLMYPLWLF